MSLARRSIGPHDERYRWVVLSNTTIAVLIALINQSIVLISLPAIFRGINLDPLAPGNVGYLLWMLMGSMLVSAVSVVALGRLGDMFGRVRTYNAGFAVFTVASLLLAVDPLEGGGGAMWLIVLRVVQGMGGGVLMANSTAIVTDAFPVRQRGMALGFNMVAGLAGSFIGLVLGGLLSEWSWRAVFLVSVPIGVVGTLWSVLSLHETTPRRRGRIDWPGNLTLAGGLTAVLVAITYGIQPYGGHSQGWTNPLVAGGLVGGMALLVVFVAVEHRAVDPLFDMRLFRIQAFAAGNAAGLLAAMARGGLQFMLIIWLQGIWLPLHGYRFEDTPLWAGILLLPLTAGFLVAGPLSGALSDRYGARLFATGGLLLTAATFAGLLVLPVDFPYWAFALLTTLNGIGSGLFAAPNTTAIMNSVPAAVRGAASGMRATFQNAGAVLSIGVFFSLMVAGLSSSLGPRLQTGLAAHHVPAPAAAQAASVPPVGSLFSAFLGYNPVQRLVGDRTLARLPHADAAAVTGGRFFPDLISGPFHDGLVVVFAAAIVMSLVAALASLLRGGLYVHEESAPRPATTARTAAGEAWR